MRHLLQVGLVVLAIGCFETSDKGSDTGSSDGDGADDASSFASCLRAVVLPELSSPSISRRSS